MQIKATLMDKSAIDRAMTRIAHEIIEKNRGVEDIILIGIQRRGVPLANELRRVIQESEGVLLPFGILDITFYRDDLSLLSDHPAVNSTSLPFSVTDKKIVLVDDVLFTGRTARAALDAVIDAGRPRLVQLAVLIDRGHRELPIRADYVGKNIPTSKNEVIHVRIDEFDGCDDVVIADL